MSLPANRPHNPTTLQCWIESYQPSPSSTLYVRATNITIQNAGIPLIDPSTLNPPLPQTPLINITTTPAQCQAACDALPTTSCLFAVHTAQTCSLIQMSAAGPSSGVVTGFANFFPVGMIPSQPPPQPLNNPSTNTTLTLPSPSSDTPPVPPTLSGPTALSSPSTSSSSIPIIAIAAGCAIGGVLIAALAVYLLWRCTGGAAAAAKTTPPIPAASPPGHV
ncbi:hypothetical protein BDK51DRAFT_36895, partial [Blyttiomyces helicus]